MRYLIVTVAEPGGDIIDRETVEVSEEAIGIALVPVEAGETTPCTISQLKI